jgi:GNAT superfamily N-acetyltransferase
MSEPADEHGLTGGRHDGRHDGRRAGGQHGGRVWHWPADLTAYRRDLVRMLAGSVADDGILGYDAPLTAGQADAFCDDLDRRVAHREAFVLIGADDVGTFAMCVVAVNAMPNCRHLCEVGKAYVDPRVRRSGAAAELLAALCRKLHGEGVERLQIDVRENSPAHHVWRGFGFQTFGVLDDYSRIGGVTHRGHFMTHTVEELGRIAGDRIARRKSAVHLRPGPARPVLQTERTTR